MQALRKEPLTVYGDGKQTRSFQYVSDLVNLFSYYYFFKPMFLSWPTPAVSSGKLVK